MAEIEKLQEGLSPPPSSPPRFGQKVKKALGPAGVVLFALFAKFKFALLAAIKYLPLLLKTGGTMIVSIGLYALAWGILTGTQ